MENGWIKLYRKLASNELISDPTALQIFIWLLVNVDRKTGKTTIGRFWTSKALNQKPTTFYKALKRLETKYKIVSLVTKKVTIKYTEVSLLNWAKYQTGNVVSDNLSNNSVTIKGQSSNNPVTHIQEVENKEYINTGESPEVENEKINLTNGVGITKEWQDKAFRYAKDLRIELTPQNKPQWLKVFKQAAEGRKSGNIERAYSYLIDYPKPLSSQAKMMFFFSIYEKGLTYGNQ